jgi:hypothetical protein
MLTRLIPLAPTLAGAMSTFSRRGDSTILNPLQGLTTPGTVVADLRALSPATLDEMPTGFLTSLRRPFVSPLASQPMLIALPDGCAASTINRFLREMNGTECLSAGHVRAHGTVVDIPEHTALRLFETTLPPPPMRNTADVPVLLRTPVGAPSVVPGGPSDDSAMRQGELEARLAVTTRLRAALCDDACRLELPLPAAFRQMERSLGAAIHALRARMPGDASTGLSSGALRGAPRDSADPTVARVEPNTNERRTLGAALRMVPRELLSAPMSHALQGLQRRLAQEAPGEGLDRLDLFRIARLFTQQRLTACPEHGSPRASRAPRDLVTLARLQRWAWPDSCFAKEGLIDDERQSCGAAAASLRHAWESGEGLDQALRRLAERGTPLPDVNLLCRLGVPQAQALRMKDLSREVSLTAPPRRDDDPS